MLSKVDCMKLNHVFGCFDPTNDWQNKKIQALFGVLDHLYNYFFLFFFDLCICVSCFNETVLTFSYLYINKKNLKNS